MSAGHAGLLPGHCCRGWAVQRRSSCRSLPGKGSACRSSLESTQHFAASQIDDGKPGRHSVGEAPNLVGRRQRTLRGLQPTGAFAPRRIQRNQLVINGGNKNRPQRRIRRHRHRVRGRAAQSRVPVGDQRAVYFRQRIVAQDHLRSGHGERGADPAADIALVLRVDVWRPRRLT